MRLLFILCVCVVAPATTFAATYMSLKSNEINVRAGPGTQYPILWVFQRKGWPVEIVDKYQHWYRIRDVEGEEGWIHYALLSRRQTGIINAPRGAIIYRQPEAKGPLARLESGNVVELLECGEVLCRVEQHGIRGWLSKNQLLMVD